MRGPLAARRDRAVRRFLPLLALLALATPAAGEEAKFVVPGPNLIVEGIPPIPLELRRAIEPYGEFRASAMLSWHPTRRELLVRQRLAATDQVHRVAEPGAKPEALTDFPDAVRNASYQPVTGEYFLFPRGEGGNEAFRLYRFDLATKAVTPVSPEGERAGTPAWTRKGDRVVFTTQLLDRNNPERTARTRLHLVDPLAPGKGRVLATFESGGWTGFAFSEDGRQLAFVEYRSANESHLWVMDVASGKRRRVSRAGKGETVRYGAPRFLANGKSLLATSDRGGEFRRLTQITIADGREYPLTGRHAHDVDEFAISFDAGRIAFTTNENGSHVLRFLDLATKRELERPPLFDGVIGGLEWRPKSAEVAFTVAAARTAGDVFSYDVRESRLARWTNGNNPAVNTSALAEPRLVKWKSFDDRMISGFHYHPPARFAGKRPVIVNVHGGPESQAKAGFIGRFNYFVNDLGVALLYPNVRGSSGFGKSFLKLDDGRRREDSVRDLGALLDWIREQPDLDADRVLVRGGSYGGYMALAAAVRFADRIAGAESVVGISNFVTFLENTESYRRDLRRAEYGDERDPAMRAFLESISPLKHAERITRPLFVVQGYNDPRVPRSEAEQIVATLRGKGTPVWFLMAKDEGHGFIKKPNADFLFEASVEFAKATILK